MKIVENNLLANLILFILEEAGDSRLSLAKSREICW